MHGYVRNAKYIMFLLKYFGLLISCFWKFVVFIWGNTSLKKKWSKDHFECKYKKVGPANTDLFIFRHLYFTLRLFRFDHFVTWHPVSQSSEHLASVHYVAGLILSSSVQRPGNTDSIFLQHCCVGNWNALLHVLPPTSNIFVFRNRCDVILIYYIVHCEATIVLKSISTIYMFAFLFII